MPFDMYQDLRELLMSDPPTETEETTTDAYNDHIKAGLDCYKSHLEPKCECGAYLVKDCHHANYCPLYEEY